MPEEKLPSNVILKESGYCISLDSKTYIVSKIVNESNTLDEPAYFLSLANALRELSRRLLNSKLKVASSEKPLEIKELAELLTAHHNYFTKLTGGL